MALRIGHDAFMQIDPSSLFVIPEGVQTRWASPENPQAARGGACLSNDGRKRAPSVTLKAGEVYTMAEETGTSGTVRRIWITFLGTDSPELLRSLRLDMYWDGAETPAVSAPLGDFFCQGLGRAAIFENAFFSNPEGRSFNCCVPMPFQSGRKIVVTNETGKDLPGFYYDVDYTIGDVHKPGTLYFHAHWRRGNPTTLLRDYEILPHVRGRGRFLGVNVGVNTSVYFKGWWGEGEVKIYLDGDTDHPTLCGTGTEDYIGTGWGLGQYANAYQGCHVADEAKLQYCFYRFHVPDPVYFHNDIRITMQQIGCWDPNSIAQMHGSGLQLVRGENPVDMIAAVKAKGHGAYERADDWSSCVYFYLDQPANELPPLAPLSQRVEGFTHSTPARPVDVPLIPAG